MYLFIEYLFFQKISLFKVLGKIGEKILASSLSQVYQCYKHWMHFYKSAAMRPEGTPRSHTHPAPKMENPQNQAVQKPFVM